MLLKISIIGQSKSGKTTLLNKVIIPALKQAGLTPVNYCESEYGWGSSQHVLGVDVAPLFNKEGKDA